MTGRWRPTPTLFTPNAYRIHTAIGVMAMERPVGVATPSLASADDKHITSRQCERKWCTDGVLGYCVGGGSRDSTRAAQSPPTVPPRGGCPGGAWRMTIGVATSTILDAAWPRAWPDGPLHPPGHHAPPAQAARGQRLCPDHLRPSQQAPKTACVKWAPQMLRA